jgi:hypothetical protein
MGVGTRADTRDIWGACVSWCVKWVLEDNAFSHPYGCGSQRRAYGKVPNQGRNILRPQEGRGSDGSVESGGTETVLSPVFLELGRVVIPIRRGMRSASRSHRRNELKELYDRQVSDRGSGEQSGGPRQDLERQSWCGALVFLEPGRAAIPGGAGGRSANRSRRRKELKELYEVGSSDRGSGGRSGGEEGSRGTEPGYRTLCFSSRGESRFRAEQACDSQGDRAAGKSSKSSTIPDLRTGDRTIVADARAPESEKIPAISKSIC